MGRADDLREDAVSPSSSGSLPLDDAGRTWDVLAAQVETFVQAWDGAAEPPALAAFVPAGPPPLRRLVLVELIKVDLEYRWSGRRAPRAVEDYLAAFPELAEGGPPCDLLYEEYHVRRRAGEAVDAQDYLKRFPRQAAELARLLGVAAAAQQTTSLAIAQRLEAVQVGETLDDFDLFALLGKGSFARVFLARQRSMQRLVALKASADSGAEPQTLAQLDHPHIVRVFDQRVLPDRGLRLLYMQYVPGGTLHPVVELVRKTPPAERTGGLLLRAVDAALNDRGEPPLLGSALRERLAGQTWPEAVCWLGARMADALGYAHGEGVLHRDVKPANVLLTAEGAPLLADFNVSFSSKLDGANPAAYFGGSLAYMSPEQLEACDPAHPRTAADLDGRSDLYSLCVVLWELLAGGRPFGDESLTGDWPATLSRLTARRRAGVDRSVAAPLPPDCPPALERVLVTGLAPDPAGRPASGEALARELELCLQPRAQALLAPAPGGWRAAVRRFALAAVLLAVLAPNAVGALFNIGYNLSEIVGRVPGAEPVFWNVQTAVNGAAFPLGLFVIGVLAWPATAAVRRRAAGEEAPSDELAARRRRCLALGHYAAAVSLAAWLLAGPVYPAALSAVLGPQSPEFYLHFMASLALCGLIAAVYPFFGVTFLAVRVLYPALVRIPAGADELAALERLGRRTWLYLLLAASVPMLAVAALVFMGSQNRLALGVLSATSVVGFGLVFLAARALQADLAALAAAVCPPPEMTRSGRISGFGSSWNRRPKK
jgi:serine/threonine protein kinase